MPKITVEIIKEKKLKLKNVVIKDCDINNIQNFPNEQNKFINTIIKNGMNPTGPMILRFHNSNKGKELSIMVQTEGHYKKNDYIKYVDVLETSKCLYTRFFGTLQQLDYVRKKMDVYAYENEILFDGIDYMVVLKEEQDKYQIDIFKQIHCL